VASGNLELDRHLQALTAALDKAGGLQARLAELRGVGSAADGLVEVNVGPGGGLTDLRLDPRAMRLDSGSLREAILDAARQATEQLTTQASAMVAEFDTGLDVAAVLSGRTPSPLDSVLAQLRQRQL
jgi:DNA-binding protein YbaB